MFECFVTLTWNWERRKFHLRQRRPLGVHQEVVKERHFLFHLFDFVSVFVQDVFPHKLWTLKFITNVESNNNDKQRRHSCFFSAQYFTLNFFPLSGHSHLSFPSS